VTVSRTRRFLYSLARLLGDYQAVKRGRVGNRVANKLIGRNVRKASLAVSPGDFARGPARAALRGHTASLSLYVPFAHSL
jgi:hypothetical protein